MANTSERLKEIISIREIKQVDIIEKTGISKGALSSYLSGRYTPKQNNIYKLAQVLRVNPAWLMGLDVPMEPAASSSPAAPAGSSAPSPGSESSALVLSDLEQDLIRAFREASPDLRTAACAVLGVKREQGSVMEGSSAG